MSRPQTFNKNCPHCGQFMRLIWAEGGAELLAEEFRQADGPQAIFYCINCDEGDTEVLTEEYEYLIFGEGIGSEYDWEDMMPGEAEEIRAELAEMRRRFENRQYRATPKDGFPVYKKKVSQPQVLTDEEFQADLRRRSEEFFSGPRDPNRAPMDFSSLRVDEDSVPLAEQ